MTAKPRYELQDNLDDALLRTYADCIVAQLGAAEIPKLVQLLRRAFPDAVARVAIKHADCPAMLALAARAKS